MKKKSTNIIIFVLALLLIGGMALQFLPGGGGQQVINSIRGEKGTPAIRVNGQAITAEHLKEIEKSNPSPFTGDAKLNDDFRTFLISQVIRQEVMRQAAKDINVTREDVNAEVDKVRENGNLKDDAAWTDALQRAGISDSEYREQTRDSLAMQRKMDEIQANVPAPTAEEMRLYYDLNPTLFQTEQRIKGREIVVDNEDKARELLKKARSGTDFAALARENSLENAENGGALGALGEGGALQAVEPVVLPKEVAAAAVAVSAPGITDVVSSGGRYYIVQVEEVLAPQTKPYEDVQGDVKTALENSKKAAAAEKFLDEQLSQANIEVVDPAWKYEDPTVAEVAGQNIPYSDVVGRVMQNQQLMMMMQSMDGQNLEQVINGMLKPSLVDQLIREYAAPSIVQQEKIPLVGTRADLASGLVAYGGRDVKVTDTDIKKAYQDNITQYQTPASATVSEAIFPNQEQAEAFRRAWQGGDFSHDATQAGGVVSERGTVDPSSGALSPQAAEAVFGDKLRAVGAVSLTVPVQMAGGWGVLAVSDLQPSRTLPLDEVRQSIETELFNQKQAAAGEEFLSAKVEALKPVNHLKEVLDAQAARVPSDAASGASISGAATSGAATDPASGAGTATP